jgi:hypothetical protein
VIPPLEEGEKALADLGRGHRGSESRAPAAGNIAAEPGGRSRPRRLQFPDVLAQSLPPSARFAGRTYALLHSSVVLPGGHGRLTS